jgi:hypothetical protein
MDVSGHLVAVDGSNAGIIDRSEDLRFASESGEHLVLGRVVMAQDLERDRTIQMSIACTKYRSGRAVTELALDGVAIA